MEAVMDVIRGIRARRAEMNVAPSRKADILIVSGDDAAFRAGEHFLLRLAFGASVRYAASAPADTSGMVSVVTSAATAYLPLAELVDLDAERARIAKERENAERGLAIVMKKLENESFVSRAPEHVVAAEREKAEKFRELLEKLKESEAALG